MALQVVLRRTDPSIITYRLQAETVSVDYDRSAIVAPLPGGTSPLLLDLGQFKVSIVIEGWISRTGTDLTDGADPIPDKDDLELATRDWWSNGITIDVPSNVEAATPTRDRYQVRIMKFRAVLKGANENRWNYTLTCLGFLLTQGVT